MKNKKVFTFKVLSKDELKLAYTATCSGNRSDCCTRVCTRHAKTATPEEWNKFLKINAGVIQY